MGLHYRLGAVGTLISPASTSPSSTFPTTSSSPSTPSSSPPASLLFHSTKQLKSQFVGSKPCLVRHPNTGIFVGKVTSYNDPYRIYYQNMAGIVSCNSDTPSPITTSRRDFLHPLSFPEAEEQDVSLSHFVCHGKDCPIVCLFPSCKEKFGTNAPPLKTRRPTQTEEFQIQPKCELESVCSRDIDNGSASDKENCEEENSEQKFSTKDQWLRHLFLGHKLVVDKVNTICSLKRYVYIWSHAVKLWISYWLII